MRFRSFASRDSSRRSIRTIASCATALFMVPGLSGSVVGQNLVAMDAAAMAFVEGVAVSPVYPGAGVLLNGYPQAPVLPPIAPLFGAVTLDELRVILHTKRQLVGVGQHAEGKRCTFPDGNQKAEPGNRDVTGDNTTTLGQLRKNFTEVAHNGR